MEENDVPQERILGMGVSLPAIIDQTRQMIPNSHVLGYYDVPCEEWISRMPYPCVVMNDASAAGRSGGRKEAGEYGVPAA